MRVHEYNARAERCEAMAKRLRSSGAKQLYENLAHRWRELANQAKPFGEQQRLDRNTADSGVRPPTARDDPAIVEALCLKHTCTVEQVGGVNADELATLNKLLHRLERFWTDQIVYQM
jgi:hypothetical protein